MFARYPGDFGALRIGAYLQQRHGLWLRAPLQPVRRGRESAVWYALGRARACFVKIHGHDKLERVRLESDLLAYLRDAGVLVSPPQPDRTGRVVGEIAGFGWPRPRLRRFPIVLLRAEQGRRVYPGTIAPAELTAVAAAVARLHRALQAYPQRARIARVERAGRELGDFGTVVRSPNGQAIERRLLEQWTALDRVLVQLSATPLRVPPTQSVLHGDLGFEHVRLVPSADASSPGVRLFDFSDFAFGPVAWDLAVMLSRLYWEHDIGLGRWERLRAGLLEGYTAVLPLTSEDQRALEPALLERLLIEIRYLARVSSRLKAPYQPQGLRKRYELAAHLIDRRAARARHRPGIAADVS